jgi:hypothetical protein
MTDSLVSIFLLCLCLGQVYALRNSQAAAVAYYICVAPLTYFSVWMGATIDPSRACGAVFIAVSMLLYRKRERIHHALYHRLLLLYLYGIGITVLQSMFWPLNAVQSSSASYTILRGVISAFNWTVALGMAAQIASALQRPQSVKLIAKSVIIVGFGLSLYAIYQNVAYSYGLPTTGIRRPVLTGMIDATHREEFASYHLDNEALTVFRPGSLVGEPKGLGAVLVLWISILIVQGLAQRFTIRIAVILATMLYVLWLTASTSAWGGGVLMLCILAIALQTHSALHAGLKRSALLILVSAVLMVGGVTYLLFKTAGTISATISARTIDRLRFDRSFGDLPEKTTLVVLAKRPLFAIVGSGLGGISFYIAEELGGTQLILTPNSGILSTISEIGILGTLLLLGVCLPGMQLIWSRIRRGGLIELQLAIVGSAALGMYFVKGNPLLLSCGLGLLIAAKQHSRSQVRVLSNAERATNCALAQIGLGSRTHIWGPRRGSNEITG